VLVQRCCKLCGESFEIVRKAGRPRVYCFACEPPGWQVVKVRTVAGEASQAAVAVLEGASSPISDDAEQ
jgi:hypothetical protein